MGHSMLGPHINVPRDQIAWLARARPRVAKILLDGLDPGWLRDARAASPDTFWVGRQVAYTTPDTLLRAAAPFQGMIDALEGENEPAIGSYDVMLYYATLEARRCEALRAAGWRAVVGNFARGTPELDYWPAFREALEAGDYLGLHEYVPALPRDPRHDLWQQLRYRQVYQALPADLRKPLIITECGVDDGAGRGWRQYGDARAYLDYLDWYDAQLRQDAARWPIVGATVFCYGRFPDDPWESFDIAGEMADALAGHIVANPPIYWDQKEETMSDLDERFVQAAQQALGEKFQDIRLALPTHPTLPPVLRPIADVDTVVVHWSATSTGTNTGTIAAYHVAGDPARGLAPAPGIRYHFVVYSWGLVRFCGDLGTRRGHAGDDDVNRRSIGICFVTDTRPTDAALASAATLIRVLREVLGRDLRVVGHRDVSPATECPGPTWREWMPALAAAGGAAADEVAELRARVATLTAERDAALAIIEQVRKAVER